MNLQNEKKSIYLLKVMGTKMIQNGLTVTSEAPTYILGADKNGRSFIHCKKCDVSGYDPIDVKFKWCYLCNTFLDIEFLWRFLRLKQSAYASVDFNEGIDVAVRIMIASKAVPDEVIEKVIMQKKDL